MSEKLLTKTRIYYELKDGKHLDEILKLRNGQECTIFKADGFPEDLIDYNKVIYIPDLELNEIPYYRSMTIDEIADVYVCLYTANDFIEICNGDEKKAKELFMVVVIGHIRQASMNRWKLMGFGKMNKTDILQ